MSASHSPEEERNLAQAILEIKEANILALIQAIQKTQDQEQIKKSINQDPELKKMLSDSKINNILMRVANEAKKSKLSFFIYQIRLQEEEKKRFHTTEVDVMKERLINVVKLGSVNRIAEIFLENKAKKVLREGEFKSIVFETAISEDNATIASFLVSNTIPSLKVGVEEILFRAIQKNKKSIVKNFWENYKNKVTSERYPNTVSDLWENVLFQASELMVHLNETEQAKLNNLLREAKEMVNNPQQHAASFAQTLLQENTLKKDIKWQGLIGALSMLTSTVIIGLGYVAGPLDAGLSQSLVSKGRGLFGSGKNSFEKHKKHTELSDSLNQLVISCKKLGE